ncbi:MAG: C40 family peptidase [Deltaproteobacteria bacterium]|nr:C40 family peptidase [Deltaproteobacteria bacterium]
MKYFFDREERVERLRTVLAGWIGTPFRHWCGVRGEGCDCIHMVLRVLEDFGFGPIKVPWYPKDWHLHRSEEILVEGITRELPVVKVSPNEVANGDIVAFRYGRVSSHVAFFLDGELVGSIAGVGVEKRNWEDENVRSRVTHVFRLVEE